MAFGVGASHDLMSPLMHLLADTCISDFDTLVFDASAVTSALRSTGQTANSLLSTVNVLGNAGGVREEGVERVDDALRSQLPAGADRG